MQIPMTFRYLFLLIFSCIHLFTWAQNSATEVRAVWLTTNWELDWTSKKLPVEKQKEQVRAMLDELAQTNINTVLFQARLRGDVFYKSSIEPWSQHYTWSENISREDDPLSFMIRECHKRGIECHAWFVTFPLGTRKQVAKQPQSIANKRPNICKTHNGEWYLDPGNPDAQTYILSLVNELVKGYDIDGIHFDYIRYPENANKFPDNDTFKKYGRGQSLQTWRRENINNLVSNIYDLVKSQKKWVQVSSSPIGKYKSIAPDNGWTAYTSVHQDAAHWMEAGKHDALYPMMYYRGESFGTYLSDWMKHANGRIIAPGIGVYRLLPDEGDWNNSDIEKQISETQKQGASGQALYRVKNVLNNTKNVHSMIKTHYKYPAKLPALTWLNKTAPNSPTNLEVFKTNDGLTCIRWQPANESEDVTYTVYTSTKDDIDLNDPKTIIATGIRQREILLKIEDLDMGLYYTVTASNRFHNESPSTLSAFFVHSNLIK